MKKIHTTILFILIGLTAFAQPTKQWDKRFDVTAGTDKGNVITTDGSCNVYVAASSNGIATGSDFLTIKYNSNGDTLWTKRYNGTGNGADVPLAIITDNSGNVYVTGKSTGSNNTGFDMLIIKYNSSGIQQWLVRYNGGANLEDIGYSIDVDNNGNVYVAGSITEIANTSPSAIVLKYNSAGVKQWQQLYQINSNSIANLVKISPNTGNVFVAWWYAHIFASQGGDTYLIEELNPANGMSVGTTYNGYQFPLVRGFANSIELDANDNIYVTSSYPKQNSQYVYTSKYFNGSYFEDWYSWNATTGSWYISATNSKLDANGNTYVLTNFLKNNRNYFKTYKLDANGSQQWVTDFDSLGTYNNVPVALEINSASPPDLYVTGYSQNANGTNDITTIKYNSAGTRQWVLSYDCGSNGDDVATNMIMDSHENIYITGYSNCNGTSQDIKTIKYSANAPIITASANVSICTGGSTNLSATGGLTYSWSPTTGLSNSTISNPVANPTTTTIYTVTGTNNFCSAGTATVTVTVNPLPTIPTITGNISICSGQNTSLSVSNPCSSCTYNWSNGMTGQNISVNSALTYTTTATNSCGVSSSSNGLTVIVHTPIPPTISASGNTSFCQGGSVTLFSSSTSNNVWSNNAITQFINVTATGNYYVTATDINNCSANSNSIPVTVYPLPSATITPNGLTTFCQGGSVLLISGSTTGNHWSNNDTTQFITVTATGNYTLTVSSVNNCSANSSLGVTVNPLPDATTTQSSYGTMITANATGATYQWMYCNSSAIPNETNQSYTAAANGYYAVIVTKNGCSDTSACDTVITVGINEYSKYNAIQLFPNPATNKLYFKNLEIKEETFLSIENILGEKIIETELKNPEINISELPPSFYIVKIKNKAGLSVLRFLKQ